MGLINFANWSDNFEETYGKQLTCGTGCGASDEAEETSSACGTGCGASDEAEEAGSACGTGCGA